MRVGAVVLAAGASARMGQPKLLLPWGSTSVLGHILHVWQQLGARQVGVVCAGGDRAVEGELDRLGFPTQGRIVNPTPAHGMFSSIRSAAQWGAWEPELTHWAIVLGDQPQLVMETLTKLLTFAAAAPMPICQPSYQHLPRHPVLLSKALFTQLGTTTAQNLKEYLRSSGQPTALCEIDDPGLDFDLDTPADYAAALSQL